MNKNMILVMLHHHGLYDVSFDQSQSMPNDTYNHCFNFQDLTFSISNMKLGSKEEGGGQIGPMRIFFMKESQYFEMEPAHFEQLIQCLKKPEEIPWIEVE